MNYIGDTNKMVSDTLRTDAEECEMFIGVSTFTPGDVQQAFHFARQLERELNAAQQRIKRLEEFANRFLNPDDLGWAIGKHDRDEAREALGKERVESK